MNKLLMVFIFFMLTSCATSFPEKQIYKGYEGTNKDDKDLSLYNLINIPHFFSSAPNIITMEVDGVDYHIHPKTVLPELGAIGLVRLEPGIHNIKVSFVDFDLLFIPTWINSKVFQGFYEFDIEVKPGKFYAAVYKSLDVKDMLSEICIVEKDQGDGNHTAVRKSTWESKTYIQCSTPSMEPTAKNIKLCRQIRAGVPLPLYDRACRTEIYQRINN